MIYNHDFGYHSYNALNHVTIVLMWYMYDISSTTIYVGPKMQCITSRGLNGLNSSGITFPISKWKDMTTKMFKPISLMWLFMV